MPPKKKKKRAKSGMKQKQRQTQIVTVNVVAPVRRRRRAKKSGSGTASGAPLPSRQQFVQTIYPTTNPFQQDMHFNLASISAQLKNLQDKSVGGVALGSVLTQQQIQLGAAPQDPSLDTTPVVRVGSPELPREAPSPELPREEPSPELPREEPSPELPREAPLVIDVGTKIRIKRKRKIKIVEDVSTPLKLISVPAEGTPLKPISVPAEGTPLKPISVPLSDPAQVSRRADGEPEDTDGEPEDTPYGSLKFKLTPSNKPGPPNLTEIEKQKRRESRELTRLENLTKPVLGELINEPYGKFKINPSGSVEGVVAYATLVGATESFFGQPIAKPSETASLTPKRVQPTIDTLFAPEGKTS